MATNDDISNSGENIGNALNDAAAAASRSKANSKALQDALRDLKGVVKSTGSAFLDSSEDFKKFNQSVDSANRFISRGSSKLFGKGGASAGISAVSSGISSLIKSLLNYNDSQLSLYDRVSKLGISTGSSADQIHSLIQSSGYWDTRFEGFVGSVERLGTGLINLGPTTSAGAAQLAKILNVTEFEDSFIKLGYSIEGLSKVQTDYIKMQESTGIVLNKNADVVKRDSLAYAESLKVLSGITGESVDKLSQTMAAQLADVKFALRIRELEMSGDKEGAARLKETAAIVDTLYGPAEASAVRDLLANGFATTKEGEGLLVKSRSEALMWAQQVNQGTMTPTEFAQRIAKANISMDQQFGKSLNQSNEFQNQLNMTARGMGSSNQIVNASSEKAVKDIIVAQRDSQKENNALKNIQIAQIKAERAAGTASGEMMKALNGPFTSAFTFLAGTVKSVALFSAQLGNFLFGKQTEAFENVIRAVGDPADIKKLETSLNANIISLDQTIAKQRKDAEIVKDRKARYEAAERKQAEVAERLKRRQPVTERERVSTADEVMITRQVYEEAKKQEAAKYGKSSEELQQERENLARRRAGVQTSYTERKKEEAKAQETTTFTKAQVEKLFQFSGGLTGDYAHFSQLDPAFAKKLVAFAENYNKLTGKKLDLQSSYRSPEEQAKLYDAWVAAGGSETKPTVNTPYGNLTTPAKGLSNHNSGNAVDIDKAQLDDTLLRQFGLTRPHKGDKVHVEAMPGARNGGVFDGATSGYPMMFHGTEAIIPMLDGKTVPLNLKNSGSDTNHAQIRSSMGKIQETQTAAAVNTPKVNSAKDFSDMLTSKVEQMIQRVSASNSIYSDIKLYMSN